MPVPPTLAEPGQLDVFFDWLRGVVASSGLSKSALGRAIRHDTTQQINKFLSGKALPMPETLKALCAAMGASWPEAFAIAGYYREILEILADLARLGDAWRFEDAAAPDDPNQVRSIGVTRVNGKILFEALKDERYRQRYHIGCYDEQPMEVEIDDSIPPERAEQIRRESARPTTRCCAMPKPSAVAIWIAAAGFPRRGDVYKDGANIFPANILSRSVPLVEMAQQLARRGRTLPLLLEKALLCLKDSSIRGARRLTAAEYVVAWADSVCQSYTYYVRLAAFELWGEGGSSLSTMTPFVHTPQFRQAALPDVDQLTKIDR